MSTVKNILKDLLTEVDRLYQDTGAAKVVNSVKKTELDLAHDINVGLGVDKPDKKPAAKKPKDFKAKRGPKPYTIAHKGTDINKAADPRTAKIIKSRNKNISSSIDNKTKTEMSRRISTGPDAPNGGEEEIPVMPFGRVANTIADYTTIELSLYSAKILVGTYASNTFTQHMTIRMNGLNNPLDWQTSYAYMGTSQWKNLYQFYRILSNDITVSAKNFTQASDWSASAASYDYAAVTVSMEPNDNTDPLLLTERSMHEGKHNVVTTIHPGTVEQLSTGGGVVANHFKNSHTFTHHYEPKQFVMANSHITNQSEEERWTAIAANPAHPHNLHIAIAPAYSETDPSITDGTVSKVMFQVHCKIVIQWREVTSSILSTPQTDA